MSLLDDIRFDLATTHEANDYLRTAWTSCKLCGGLDGHHEGDCSTPRILAVVEAAERFVELAVSDEPRWKAVTDYDLRLAALVSALRGEEVTR